MQLDGYKMTTTSCNTRKCKFRQMRPVVLPMLIDFNRSSVTFALSDWLSVRFFIVDKQENSIFWNIFLKFYFYTSKLKKWNSKLSTWVILDSWSIKMRKIDKIALNKSTQKYWYFSFLHEIICCGYSLETPLMKTCRGYPQHVFMEK